LEGEVSTKITISQNNRIEQHSLGKSVLLHLLPGFLFTILYLLGVQYTIEWGVPAYFLFLIVGALFLIPFELGYLVYQAKKQNKSFCVKEIIGFQNKITKWQYIIIPVLLLGWIYFIALVVNPPIENTIVENFFSWVPDYYFLESLVSQVNQYSKSLLIFSAVFGIFINGLLGPIVEELYFRGYLLPRISRFGYWAPLLNTVLFSLYHFFTPWQNPLRIMALLPVFYSVWWRKNIYLGIIVHCIMNLMGSFMLLMTIFKMVE